MEFNQHQREVFKTLHETKEYSDLTLVCEDKQFPVHKAIVCTQSSVIAAACNGRFTEASENVVRVTEFDATTLKRMLEFMYLGEYEVQDTAHIGIKTVLEYQNELLNLEYTEHSSKHGNSNDDNSIKCDYNSSKPEPDFGEWTIETECNEFNECNECNKCNERNANAILTMLEPHIGVNAIADYYNVSALKDRAQAMILYILRTSWSASGFLDAVGEIFQTTADKRLHGIIASTAMDHLQELIGTKQFAEMDLPSVFAVDVIRRTGERLREMEDKLQDVETQRGDVWNWTSRLISESSKEAWDLKAVNERLNSAIARIQANTNCRHCSAEFNCVIREKQRPGRTSTYVVRCRRCGTKHY